MLRTTPTRGHRHPSKPFEAVQPCFLPERILRYIDVDSDSSHLFGTASTTPGGYRRISRDVEFVMLPR